MRDELIPYRVRTTGPRLEDVFAFATQGKHAGLRRCSHCRTMDGIRCSNYHCRSADKERLRTFHRSWLLTHPLLSDLAPCPKKVTGDLSFQTGERLIEPFF